MAQSAKQDERLNSPEAPQAPASQEEAAACAAAPQACAAAQPVKTPAAPTAQDAAAPVPQSAPPEAKPQAEVKSAEPEAELAESKAESAESKAESAESKAESAEPKAETAEAKTESAEAAAPAADAPRADERQYHPIILSDVSAQASTSFWRGYSRFWPFLKPYWPMALLGIILTIPVGALDAVIAWFLKPFTDQVMVEQQAEFAYYVPLVVVGFTLIQGIFIYASSLVNGYVGGAINLLMRSRLYQKLLTFDSRFFDANNSGSVILRFFNDSETASSGLVQNIRLFLTKFFSSLSLVGVLLYNSWELTIFAVGIVGFLIVPMQIVRKRIKSLVSRTINVSTGMITLYNETALGSKVIKSFNLKQFMYERFRAQADYLFKMALKMIRDTNWLAPVMHLVSSLGVAGVLYFGVTLILSGRMTSGEMVSFLAALIMLYTPLKSIGNNYIQVQTALLALDRIYDLLDYESFENGKHEGSQVLTDIKDSIEFEHVVFSYNGERDVLQDLSFKVKVGQKVALVGNSGGGKTTVCSLINRLYEVKSGSIKIDGIDIRDYTIESLRRQIACVFQDNFLFAGTIRQNILFGKEDATDEEIAHAVKSAYLDEFVASLPDGLDTQIGERGVSLSGGQKQRIAIARAIIRNAPLVILDEATSALDNRSEKVVQQALDELMKGRTTLVIAHRLSTIQDADTIMVINDGQIVEQGNHQELLAQGGAYASLYNTQFVSKHKAQADAESDAAEGTDEQANADAAAAAAAGDGTDAQGAAGAEAADAGVGGAGRKD